MVGAAPEIRSARAGDLGALVDLEARAFPDPWSPAMLAGELGNAHAFQLLAFPPRAPGAAEAVEETAPVGYAAFRAVGGEAELLRLAVVPEARRHGVGRALLEHGLARLAAEGVAACFLEVRETNLPAIRLYEGLGFAAAGRRRGYYPDGTDARIYRLELPAPPS